MTTFQPQNNYRLLALVSFIMTVLFGWSLLQGMDTGSALFFFVSAGLVVWSIRASQTKALVTPKMLKVTAPLSRSKEIEYGQMISVSEEGRIGKAIVVAYHPRMSNGLLDLDSAHNVVLPGMQNQNELYELLIQKANL